MSEITAPICYSFHHETGVYVGSMMMDESPLEPDVWLMPANSTLDAPPPAGAGEIAVRAGDVWTLMADQRGQRYWLADGSEHVIGAIGETLPDGALDAPPPPTDQQLADAARARRDALITATDYLLMPDYPISAEQLAEVRAYRQVLRDVPLQEGFPQTIDWPTPPIITTQSKPLVSST